MPKVRIHSAFPALAGQQARASMPQSSDVWLSASAGTGKTQVLVARVLRLLLHGAKPEAILCLTFTKAGAAEMAIRVNEVLAAWVTLPGTVLATDLKNLGEDFGLEAQGRARELFARVLDAKGGLRIQTIHSFCQMLLGGFPAEAGLTPGFRPIEGREEAALAASALAEMVADADRTNPALIERLKRLSHRMGEDAARAHLSRCAAHPQAMEAIGPAQAVEERVGRWLTGSATARSDLVALCADDQFPKILLDDFRAMNCGWLTKAGTQTTAGRDAMERIDAWIGADQASRYATLAELMLCWRTATGDMRKSLPPHGDCAKVVDALDQWLSRLIDLKRAADIVSHIANALVVGQAYARAYAEAKTRAGAVDFNDLIRRTVALLGTPGIGEWIAYKLDQRTDHILVDEAQDTNAAQWSIVEALTGEFFAGSGQKGEKTRTLFTVGDYKQAIFGFQGTDPREFDKARARFTALARAAERDPIEPALTQSFRSSQPILDVVDATIAAVGIERFGRIRSENHKSARGGWGNVTLWPPVALGVREDGEEGEAEEAGFTTTSERIFAERLAETIKGWVDGGLTLPNHGDRPVRPGDIMILVRSRGELARLIVSRLYEVDVEVAGVDRLRLGAPIAVKDLMAAVRFVLQPADDLNLAALLVSPLLGWTQDDLYEHAGYERNTSLWQQLGGAKPTALTDLLNRADFDTPYRFIEYILSGPLRGRKRLIARLGEEARDPIEELVNAALAFEREGGTSLQQFVAWFDRGETDIKREAGQAGDAVRVMTVHGAKGLQAPVVILADATADPDFKHPSDMDWQADPETRLPLFRPRKEELTGSLLESAQARDLREREEHWRLLYVAMTRAEQHLFIGGALRPRQTKGMGADCWHVKIAEAMTALGHDADERGHQVRQGGTPLKAERKVAPAAPPFAVPDWLEKLAPEEARPPRPLAPSAIRPDDTVPDPPPPAALRETAERGVLLHALFERLPAVDPAVRRAKALSWLERARGVNDAAVREELIESALSVIEHPGMTAVFSGEALTEAPLAGVVDGQVIAGTVDRLLISVDSITVVDFKTGRRVPRDADSVPPHHLAQMAAYSAVLSGIFPGKRVEAALLYSHEAKLIPLPPRLLEKYRPGASV